MQREQGLVWVGYVKVSFLHFSCFGSRRRIAKGVVDARGRRVYEEGIKGWLDLERIGRPRVEQGERRREGSIVGPRGGRERVR